MGEGGLDIFCFFLTRGVQVWNNMQNWQKYYCFYSLNMTRVDPILFPNLNFAFYLLLPACLNYFQVQTFFQKSVFYLTNLNATKYDSWQGEGGVSQFQIFFYKGGMGGSANFGLWLTRVGSGPPMFGWHSMLTSLYTFSPNLSVR